VAAAYNLLIGVEFLQKPVDIRRY